MKQAFGCALKKMLNAIIGNQSDDHKDWNNDGTINDLSDGFGLLLNGENEGYIQGTISHAGFAAEAEMPPRICKSTVIMCRSQQTISTHGLRNWRSIDNDSWLRI